MLKLCPDCGSSLGFNAYKCRCGWNATMVSQGSSVDCFFAPGCARPARLRTDRYGVKGQIMQLCYDCADNLHLKRGEDFCKANGLTSVQQRIEYCRRMFKEFSSRIGKTQHREPGQDDEELAT